MQSRPQWPCIQNPIKGDQSWCNKYNVIIFDIRLWKGFMFCKELWICSSRFFFFFYLLGTFPVLPTSQWARWVTHRIASWTMTSMPTTSKTIWLTTPLSQVSSIRDDNISQTKLTLTASLFGTCHLITFSVCLCSWKWNHFHLHGERVLTR